jgi:hypothetical protein
LLEQALKHSTINGAQGKALKGCDFIPDYIKQVQIRADFLTLLRSQPNVTPHPIIDGTAIDLIAAQTDGQKRFRAAQIRRPQDLETGI